MRRHKMAMTAGGTGRRGAGATRRGHMAPRILLGIGLVAGVCALSVGDAAAGPLDGASVSVGATRDHVTASVSVPTLPGPLTGVTASVPQLPVAVPALPPAPALPLIPASSPQVSPGSGSTGVVATPTATPTPVPGAAGPGAGAGAPNLVALADPAPAPARLSAAAVRPVAPTTGWHAVLDAARSSTALFVLAAAACLFLVVQRRIDRRSPQLVDAPIDHRSGTLEFS